MRKPKLVGPQAIVGWRRDGRPIRMIGGGAPDTDDDTKDQGQKKDGDKDDGSLLESDADDLTGDGDNDGDTDDSDGKAKNGGSVDKDTLVAEVTKSLETKIASMFDRRVNAVLKEIRKTGATGQNDDKAGGKTGDTTQPDAGTASTTDLRGARMAFREYIGDEIRYISQEEKRFGTDLGQALLRARAADGFDDEDRAGREVAQQVAQQVKALRAHYAERTKRALRKQGALVDKLGQTAAGPNGGVGAQSEYQKGAEIAKARFADRITAKT